MSYSYYEVYTYTHRAFEGLGFPYGADEDAAFIITWLELYNLDGVHLLASNINKFDQKYDGVVDQMHSDNLINLNLFLDLFGSNFLKVTQMQNHEEHLPLI